MRFEHVLNFVADAVHFRVDALALVGAPSAEHPLRAMGAERAARGHFLVSVLPRGVVTEFVEGGRRWSLATAPRAEWSGAGTATVREVETASGAAALWVLRWEASRHDGGPEAEMNRKLEEVAARRATGSPISPRGGAPASASPGGRRRLTSGPPVEKVIHRAGVPRRKSKSTPSE